MTDKEYNTLTILTLIFKIVAMVTTIILGYAIYRTDSFNFRIIMVFVNNMCWALYGFLDGKRRNIDEN